MKEYTFTASISVEAYTTKPKDIAAMSFHERTLTIPDFASLITQGFSYCNLFEHTGACFGTKEKCDMNFRASYLLSVDCDNMDMPMNECLSRISVKPSISYTTPSNGEGGLYRYRFIYALSSPIVSKAEYKSKYNGLIAALGVIPNDGCGAKCSQYFNGSYGCEIAVSDTVLRLEDIQDGDCGCDDTKPSRHTSDTGAKDSVSGAFYKDWNTLPRGEFLFKYAEAYGSWKRASDKTYKEGVCWYDESHCEITPPFMRCADGSFSIRRVRDGHRRDTLLAYANDIRFLNPDMTAEGFLYALTEIVHHWFNCTDGHCTNEWIWRTAALKVWSTPYDELKPNFKPKHRYALDGAYCAEHNITKRMLQADIERGVKDESIAEWFDPLKTDRENVAVLKEHGISRVGIRSIRSYRRRHGLDRMDMQLHLVSVLLSQGKDDDYIIRQLGVSRRTYFSLKSFSAKNGTLGQTANDTYDMSLNTTFCTATASAVVNDLTPLNDVEQDMEYNDAASAATDEVALPCDSMAGRGSFSVSGTSPSEHKTDKEPQRRMLF